MQSAAAAVNEIQDSDTFVLRQQNVTELREQVENNSLQFVKCPQELKKQLQCIQKKALYSLNFQDPSKFNSNQEFKTVRMMVQNRSPIPSVLVGHSESSKGLSFFNNNKLVRNITLAKNDQYLEFTFETSFTGCMDRFRGDMLIYFFPYLLVQEDWTTYSYPRRREAWRMFFHQNAGIVKKHQKLFDVSEKQIFNQVWTLKTINEAEEEIEISREFGLPFGKRKRCLTQDDVSSQKRQNLKKLTFSMLEKKITEFAANSEVISFQETFFKVYQEQAGTLEQFVEQGLSTSLQCNQFSKLLNTIFLELVDEYVLIPDEMTSDMRIALENATYKKCQDSLKLLICLSLVDYNTYSIVVPLMYENPRLTVVNNLRKWLRNDQIRYGSDSQFKFNEKAFRSLPATFELPLQIILQWAQQFLLGNEYPVLSHRPITSVHTQTLASTLIASGVSGSGKTSILNSLSDIFSVGKMMHKESQGIMHFQKGDLIGKHIVAIEEAGRQILSRAEMKAICDITSGHPVDVKYKDSIMVGQGQPVFITSNYGLGDLTQNTMLHLEDPIIKRSVFVPFTEQIQHSAFSRKDLTCYIFCQLFFENKNSKLREEIAKEFEIRELVLSMFIPYMRTEAFWYQFQTFANTDIDSFLFSVDTNMKRDTCLAAANFIKSHVQQEDLSFKEVKEQTSSFSSLDQESIFVAFWRALELYTTIHSNKDQSFRLSDENGQLSAIWQKAIRLSDVTRFSAPLFFAKELSLVPCNGFEGIDLAYTLLSFTELHEDLGIPLNSVRKLNLNVCDLFLINIYKQFKPNSEDDDQEEIWTHPAMNDCQTEEGNNEQSFGSVFNKQATQTVKQRCFTGEPLENALGVIEPKEEDLEDTPAYNMLLLDEAYTLADAGLKKASVVKQNQEEANQDDFEKSAFDDPKEEKKEPMMMSCQEPVLDNPREGQKEPMTMSCQEEVNQADLEKFVFEDSEDEKKEPMMMSCQEPDDQDCLSLTSSQLEGVAEQFEKEEFTEKCRKFNKMWDRKVRLADGSIMLWQEYQVKEKNILDHFYIVRSKLYIRGQFGDAAAYEKYRHYNGYERALDKDGLSDPCNMFLGKKRFKEDRYPLFVDTEILPE